MRQKDRKEWSGIPALVRPGGDDTMVSVVAEITVSEQENLVYIRKAGAVGFDGLQSLEDLRSKWNSLMDAAGLTADERKEAVQLFRARVETVTGAKL